MTIAPLLSPEVDAARAGGRAIVALESTIITHGMPWPRNLETARRVEDEVRAAGATPATVAVIEGRLHVGLSAGELEALAGTGGAAKLSRADLAACLATGGTGATTVAATMIAARLAGIAVFATGGIGGVHRGAETSFDISADLRELSQTPVTVVAAGAKAILDLPKTLEVLETLGVPVITVDRTSSRRSGRAGRGWPRRSAWTTRATSPAPTGCAPNSAFPAASSSPIRFPRRPRSRARRSSR